MVNKKKVITLQLIIYSFTQCILLCCMFLFDNYVFCTIVSLIIMILQVLVIKGVNKSLYTFPMFFLVVSYILHAGRMLMILFFDYEDSVLLLGEANISLSLIFVSMSHLMFVLGSVSTSKTRISTNNILKIDRKTFRMLATISIIVGIYPRIYILIFDLSIVRTQGYLGLFSSSYGHGVYSILELFYFFGILAFIFTETNIVRARIVFIVSCLVEVISMFTGGRMYAISHIIVYIYIYCTRIEKPKAKQLLIIVCLLYLLCVGMSVVAEIRDEGFSGADLIEAIKKSFGTSNPIVELIGELGGTIKSLVYSIIYVPAEIPFANGKSYFNTILISIPFLEQYADSTSLCYIKNFQGSAYMGGSWLGEIYYNFSWAGIIFAYILGKVCGSFERIYDKADKENNYIGVIVVISFLSELIIYEREYFSHFSKSIQLSLAIIVCGVFYTLFTKKYEGRRHFILQK